MPRKKIAKRTAKRKMPNNALSAIQQIEKDLFAAPAQLAAQINKEIASLKQQENKLKTVINKIKAQVQATEKRMQVASSKKQFDAAKKARNKTIKTETTLSSQLQQITKLMGVISNKQAKMTALRKNLNQFGKEWAKNSKALMVKAKTKTDRKKPKTKNKALLSTTHPPQTDHFDTTVDNRLNEVTESAL